MALLALIFIILHLLTGLVLPYKAGYLPYFYHYMFEAGVDFEKRLNRAARPQSVRIVRGTAVALQMGVLGGITGFIISYAGRHVPYGFGIELIFLSCCITFMTPMKVVRQIQKHLAVNDLPGAIAALQPYTPEPLANEDIHTVVRKTAEFIAISLNRFLLAPIFWLILTGPIGLSLYVTYSAAQHAFCPPDNRRKYFGQFVRLIDTVMNIVPAAISALFLIASALFVSRSSPLRAAVTVFSQARRYGFFYQGWLITALAGGLGVTLGGPVRYSTEYSENHEWVGPPEGSARLMPEDLSRAALLQYAFFMCVILFVSALIIVTT